MLSLLEKEDITSELEELLNPLKMWFFKDNEKIKNVNMVGCLRSQWKNSMQNLRCKIARLTKSIQNQKSKILAEQEERYIEIEHKEIYQAFKSIEPVLQKIILYKFKNKQFDIQSKIFWMHLFCFNHSFFDMFKILLKTTYPSYSVIYCWFNKIVHLKFWDFLNINKTPDILRYFAEKLKYYPGERFSLSFDGLKCTPGLQRSSLKENFYGFTSEYNSQGQKDIQKLLIVKLVKSTFYDIVVKIRT